jgi:hypothetical protein
MSVNNRRLERLARLLEEISKPPPRDVHGDRHVLRWSPQYAYSKANVNLLKAAGPGSWVYEVWELRSELWVAVYVGETDRLGQRLEEHMSEQEENPNFRKADFRRLAVSFAQVLTEASRKDVERALWKLYLYDWNDVNGPKGARGHGTLILDEGFPELYSVNYNGVRRWLETVGSYVPLP